MVDAVVGDVDPGRVGAEHPDQLVPGRLGRHDQPGGPPGRGADRGLEEGGRDRVVRVRLGEERQVVDGHHHGHAGPQRHRVVRRVDHVRRPTCWATSGRPVCSQASRAGRCAIAVGPATTWALGHQPAVPLLVGPLADHGQVGSRRLQGADQSVDVAARRRRGPRALRSRRPAHEAPRASLSPFREQVLSGRGGLRPPPFGMRMSRQDRAYALAGNNAASRRRRTGRGFGPLGSCSSGPAIAELPGLTGARLRRCPGLGLRR